MIDRILPLGGIAVTLLTVALVTLDGGAPSALAADDKVIAVTSTNPFDFHALIQDPTAGGAVPLEAELIFPPNAPEDRKLPAVIFVHGSSGPLGRHERWLGLIHDLGIATIRADHLRARGQFSTIGDHTNLTGAAMTADVLRLLKAAAAHPRLDPARIGIMGSSKGGGVAIYGAWTPLRRRIAGEQRFAVHIALYPPCIYWQRKDFSGAPILLMIGSEDNWTGVRHCVESTRELQEAGVGNIEVKLYSGAHHGFDSGTALRTISNGYSLVDCRFEIGPDGQEYASGIRMGSVETKRRALEACAKRGVTLGGRQDLSEAMSDVRMFLQKTLLQ